MAGTSSSIKCNSCQGKLAKSKRPDYQNCGACQDYIYAGARSALYCEECEEHFHDFCLKKPDKEVKFEGKKGQIILSLTKVARTTPKERCEACEDPLTGLTRYSNGVYNVHPECAVNLVPSQGVEFHTTLPNTQRVNCMLCKKVDKYKWSYVITEGTEQRGCHLHCLREQLIMDEDESNKHKLVDLETYFKTVGTPNGGLEKFIRLVALILTAAGSLAPPPLNGIITQGVRIGAEEAVIYTSINIRMHAAFCANSPLYLFLYFGQINFLSFACDYILLKSTHHIDLSFIVI